jgi:Tol biopolymer transport system component
LTTDLSGSQGLLVEDASPAYSPDGLQVAFARKSLLPEEWSLGRQLWLMAADGSGARPLTNEPNVNHASLQWHPNGTRLAYVRFNQAGLNTPTELWWYDFESDQHGLVVTGGFSPRWMP